MTVCLHRRMQPCRMNVRITASGRCHIATLCTFSVSSNVGLKLSLRPAFQSHSLQRGRRDQPRLGRTWWSTVESGCPLRLEFLGLEYKGTAVSIFSWD